MPVISVAEIKTASREALKVHGASEWIAASVARAVADAEAYGNVICGLYYLESYCLQLASGRVNGTVMPEVTAPRPGSILSDAKFGFAQSAFQLALPQAVAAAKTNGTVSLAIAHAHTCTSLGFFTAQLAVEGMLAIGFTNASPAVAPPGGNQKVIGTNPIAMSVPDGQGGISMHFDFSTSAVALGKITMAKAAGKDIPIGWAVDKDGVPTTDPTAALGGALVSSGGYKGWGFGLMAELLAAGITGSVNSLDVGSLKLPDGVPHGLGQFYFIVDPSTHHHDFATRLERLVEAVSVQEGARLPGSNRKALTEIDVPDALWAMVSELIKGPV